MNTMDNKAVLKNAYVAIDLGKSKSIVQVVIKRRLTINVGYPAAGSEPSAMHSARKPVGELVTRIV